eukprot:2535296-Pyramimonas_sp.AAC.1
MPTVLSELQSSRTPLYLDTAPTPSHMMTKQERPLPRCCPGSDAIPDPPEKGSLKIYQGHASERYIERIRAQADLHLMTENDPSPYNFQTRAGVTSPVKGQTRSPFVRGGTSNRCADNSRNLLLDRWLNNSSSKMSVASAPGYTQWGNTKGLRLPVCSPRRSHSVASQPSSP